MERLIENARKSEFLIYLGLQTSLVLLGFTLYGCVTQEADLKQTEREIQRRIKQQAEEQAQTRARQNQEIVSLREQDIPSLRDDIGKLFRRVLELEGRQGDLLSKMSTQKQRDGNSSLRSNSKDIDLKTCEARLDQHDELITSLLMKVQELTQSIRNKSAN